MFEKEHEEHTEQRYATPHESGLLGDMGDVTGAKPPMRNKREPPTSKTLEKPPDPFTEIKGAKKIDDTDILRIFKKSEIEISESELDSLKQYIVRTFRLKDIHKRWVEDEIAGQDGTEFLRQLKKNARTVADVRKRLERYMDEKHRRSTGRRVA